MSTASPAGMVVAVAGTNVSATADVGGQFSLTNVPPADVVLTFSAPGVSASTPVGAVAAAELVEIAVTVSGGVATIDAEQRTGGDNSIVANGVLSDLNLAGRQFRIGSTLVQVTESAVIKRGDVVVGFADLKNGDKVYVRGMKDGSVVRASEVLAVPGPPPPVDSPVTLTGVVAALGGSCPALSMTVAGTAVRTSSATAFAGTKGCSILANGDAVSVEGTKQSDGTVLASKLSYTGPPPPTDVTLNGSVVGLAGACPVVSLTVDGTAVKTNSATVFSNRACAELKNGDTVYVVGPKQSDGSVLASKVYYVSSPVTEVTVNGTVSSLGGSCPALSMTVAGTPVKTSSATTFDGAKGCSVTANGDSVTVVGTKQSDGSVLASKVTNTTPPPPADVYVNGPIVGLTGACPAISFSLSGTPVKTTSATTFNGRACVELKNGDVIYAAGPKQADGSILANRTYYTPPTVTLTGTVSNVAGSCPAVTFSVQGTVVKGNSATAFDGTKGCSVMANGDSVTVVGTTQSDGSVLASRVTNATAPPPADVYVNGPIVGLTGACPAISFSLSGTPVKTTSATTFNGRACVELKNGDVIYAAGPKQADGSILANRTYYTPPTVTLTGTVSNVTGSCPAVTFSVQGTVVKGNSATSYDGTKGCSVMANGDSVTVVGTTQSDGSVLASKVTNATAPPPADTTLNGAIAGLGGSCPALTMTVAGGVAKTNSSTVFTNKTCAELKNGDTVYAIGPKQSDGTVLASKIYFVK